MREINKDKLMMKNLINIDTSTGVDVEDFLYTLFQIYEEKEWDIQDSRSMTSFRRASLRLPIKGMNFHESFEELERKGWISITEKNKSTHYTIINHPW